MTFESTVLIFQKRCSSNAQRIEIYNCPTKTARLYVLNGLEAASLYLNNVIRRRKAFHLVDQNSGHSDLYSRHLKLPA